MRTRAAVMEYYAGIDGGQSSTTAVVGDADGRIIGRGEAGGCDELGAHPTSTRLRDALESSLRDALRVAQLSESTQLRAVVAGISGYNAQIVGTAPRFLADRVTLMHDAPIAHAGALGGDSGVVVIAGTGSVAYGRDDRDCVATFGGLGYVFGDEGSAFAIVRNALAACLRSPHAACSVAAKAAEFFAQSSAAEIVKSFYDGAISRERLASFARVLLDNDTNRDLCARNAVARAQSDLAALACDAQSNAVFHWEGSTRVAFLGGLMQSQSFRTGVHAQLASAQKSIRVIEPRYDGVAGALLLAYRSSGVRIEELQYA